MWRSVDGERGDALGWSRKARERLGTRSTPRSTLAVHPDPHLQYPSAVRMSSGPIAATSEVRTCERVWTVWRRGVEGAGAGVGAGARTYLVNTSFGE